MKIFAVARFLDFLFRATAFAPRAVIGADVNDRPISESEKDGGKRRAGKLLIEPFFLLLLIISKFCISWKKRNV